MADRDLQGLRAYAEELSNQFEKIRGGLTDMQRKLTAVTASAKSADGHVTATVGARGQLVKLQLDPRIYRTPDSAKLAETITETVHTAAEEAAGKVQAVVDKYAAGTDVTGYLRGDLASRLSRFDFVHDQLAGGSD
jgi:DNA-binding protein YbaB